MEEFLTYQMLSWLRIASLLTDSYRVLAQSEKDPHTPLLYPNPPKQILEFFIPLPFSYSK